MDKILKFLNHERYESIAVIIACLLLIWFWGCESKVQSISNPNALVTRDELNAEVDFYLANAEIRYKNLDRQDEFKKTLLEAALLYGQTGTINPFGLITTLAGILGVGATIDNVRKRKEIKRINGS